MGGLDRDHPLAGIRPLAALRDAAAARPGKTAAVTTVPRHGVPVTSIAALKVRITRVVSPRV